MCLKRDLSNTGHGIVVGNFRAGEQMAQMTVWANCRMCGIITGPKSTNHVILEIAWAAWRT